MERVPSAAVPRPRVLVLADSANPEWSSASLVGWSLTRALRAEADVHLATHVRNRPALERAGWVEGQQFTSIDPGAVEDPVTRVGEAIRKVTRLGWTWTTAFSIFGYYHFENLVWRRFGPALRGGGFDVVHRITPVSPAVPSVIARRLRRHRVPFVWGPMNGGVPWPKEFRAAMRREGEWLSYLRGGRKLLPGYRSSRRDAAAILTGSTVVWNEMAPYHARCVYLPENAIDPERFTGIAAAPRQGPLRVAFVGRLVALKGVDMLLEAAAPLLRSGRMLLDIIGDGPEMPALKRQMEELHVASFVGLPGWMPDQKDVLRRLAGSQVFAFPSIREFGGGVVLEAMALGLLPIVVNSGGPGELVTDETGFRVPLGPRAAIVEGFRSILEELAGSSERGRGMGERARARVLELFTWEVKARQVREVYRWVLGQRDRPDFGMPLREAPAASEGAVGSLAGGQ
ncbi:MAG TPA: glycosyltransferase family 4 protein [Myxococcaceae bacterium]|nr:glycosyltransferase family 4 protein [Myxococcaceae bacterium]